MNYYPFHIGDYRSATMHLSNDEDLAYRRLLDLYYDTESPIPLDTQWVSRRLRLGTQDIETVLNDFFERTESGWVHARCDAEIADYNARAARARDNGKKRGARKAAPILAKNPIGTQSVPSGFPTLIQPSTNQEPITNNQEPVKKNIRTLAKKPHDVPQAVWDDFTAIRKAKRSPLSETALHAIEIESGKAGITLTQALETCCARGWQGFRAEWVAAGLTRNGSGIPAFAKRAAIEAHNEAVINGLLRKEGIEP